MMHCDKCYAIDVPLAGHEGNMLCRDCAPELHGVPRSARQRELLDSHREVVVRAISKHLFDDPDDEKVALVAYDVTFNLEELADAIVEDLDDAGAFD